MQGGSTENLLKDCLKKEVIDTIEKIVGVE
jgi:hypothetical protein